MKIRLLVCAALALAISAMAAVPLSATVTVRWLADGTQNLTEEGWSFHLKPGDAAFPTKSYDYSVAVAPDTLWQIVDNNSPNTAYMRGIKDPTGMSSSQGLVMARVRVDSESSSGGTFGYSYAGTNQSVVMSIRPGDVAYKTAMEGSLGSNTGVSGNTGVFRVYAFRYYLSGGNLTMDAWVSNGADWSSSSGNWTQLVSARNIATGQSAYKNVSNVSLSGVLLGSYGGSIATWSGYVDYIAYSTEDTNQLPWAFDPTAIPPANDSAYVSDTIPSSMVPGQQYSVAITLQNTGTNTWTQAAGYKLGAVGDSDPFCGFSRVELGGGDSIGTNQQKTFSFTMTAPTTPGLYTTDWRMIQEGGAGWFGYTLTRQVNVSSATPYDTDVISDTIPATMTAGQQYSVSVTMKNTGSNTWTKADLYKLGAVDDSDPFAGGRVELDAGDSIAEGQQKTFAFTMTAPSTPGTYTTDWRMVREAVCWFGDTLTKQVQVQAAASLLLIDDPLTQGDVPPIEGTRYRGGISPSTYGSPGVFVNGVGWQITQGSDAIYYHMPAAVTKGKAEFEIKGLRPRELGPGMNDKTELFHMYDYTYQNADNNYTGYRNNPFKMYMRKIGLWSEADPAPNVDKFELVWQIQPGSMEPDSNERPAWDPNTWYKFEVEWFPDGKGNTILTMKMNEMPITTSTSFWMEGWWNPGGHSIRLAGMHPSYGGPVDAYYRNVKVWQYGPIAPVVVRPIKNATYNTRTPTIEWVCERQTRYQLRVCTSNDPNTGIAWDSGTVNSSSKQVTTGTLADLTNYYVFAKTGNEADWSDWSASGYSFRVDTSYVNPRTGNVSVNGDCMTDSGGTFLALGATYMRGMQKCKYYRDRFERDLSVLAANGFNYVRILTMVGWDQMEIAPLDIDKGDWTLSAWTDYWQQFTDMIDIAYDEYRIRTEITIFADAQNCMPNSADRYTHMDSILSNLVGRQHKVMMIEVANEFWQNGFDLPGGISTVRTFGSYLAARTSIPIALSSPYDSGSDSAIQEMYSGSAADITTVHLTRDMGTSEGGWLPVRDAWRIGSLYPTVPPASSNEPIGPGYVPGASEDDPIKLSSAATFAWISKLPMYVYHSRPGVGGVIRPGFPNAGESITYEESEGIDAYRFLAGVLPTDLPNWTRNDGKTSADRPFIAYCNGVANAYWTDIGGATSGCHRNIGGISGGSFVCYPQGILENGLTLEARQPMALKVYNPLTGAIVADTSKNTGEQLFLAQGPGAYIIKGTIGSTRSGVTSFVAVAGDAQNTLSWVNPGDADLLGVKVLFKTTGYPSSPTDGTTAYDGTGTGFVHSGLTNGTIYYYSAYAYYPASVYGAPATASATPLPAGTCLLETFPYPNGALNGNNGWSGTAGTEIQVLSQELKIIGGSTTTEQVRSVSCSGTSGVIDVRMRIKSGSGASTLWSLYVDDASGVNLARWYGTGTTARPRIGATGLVLDAQTLTGGWDALAVRINTNTDNDDFYFNGVYLGTLSHSGQGAGNSVGRVRFERILNTTTSDIIYLDSLSVGARDATGPVAVTNLKAVPGNATVALTWTNPGGDYWATKILYKTTGYPTGPTDGTVIYAGAGASSNHTGLSNGTRYYYAAYAYDMFSNYSPVATTSATPAVEATIIEAKGLANGEKRLLSNKIVTAAFTGYFYAQEPDGYQGIKALSSTSVAIGNEVDLTGAVGGSGAERYIDTGGDPVMVTAPGPGDPGAVGMGNASLGGVDLNPLTPGVTGGVGAYNIGLLVTVWGEVTQRDTAGLQYFYIDDGAGLKDGTQTGGVDNVGIRVKASPTGHNTGDYVAVTGISCFTDGGLRRQVLPRAGGIQPLAP